MKTPKRHKVLKAPIPKNYLTGWYKYYVSTQEAVELAEKYLEKHNINNA